MGTAIRRTAFLALLVAPAALCGTATPVRAELTPEQSVKILEVKINSQKTQTDAVKILDGSQDAEARRAAQDIVDNCQKIYNRAEALLVKN